MSATAPQPQLPHGAVLDERWRIDDDPVAARNAWVFAAQDLRSHRPVVVAVWPPTGDRLAVLRTLDRLSRAFHPALAPLLGSGLHGEYPYAVLAAAGTPIPWDTIGTIPAARRAAWLFAYADAARYLTTRGLPLPAPEEGALWLDGEQLQLLPLGSLHGAAAPTIDAGTAQLSHRLFPDPPADLPAWWSTIDALRGAPHPLGAVLSALGTALGRRATAPPLLPSELPLAGREEALGALSAAIERLAQGNGGALLLGGTSGSGKSRLADEAALLARSLDLVVRRLPPAPHAYQTYAWADWLQLLGQPNGPALQAESGDPRRAAGDAARRVLSLIAERTDARPLLLIVENAHQLPLEMRRLLEQLLPLTRSLPLLLLITHRDDLLPDLPRGLRRVQNIHLRELDLAAITHVLHSMLGPDGVAEPLPGLILQRTGGNPLLLTELLLTSAAIGPGTEGLGQALALLSGGVGALVGHRQLHLQPGERRLLQTAALLGNSLEPDLLQTFDEVALVTDWLAAAAQLGILACDNGEWRFTHALVATETAASVGLADRPVRHAAIAARLEAQGGIRPARLAGHWLDAGESLRGAGYARRAGDAARRQGLLTRAKRFYELSADALSAAADRQRQQELVEVVVLLVEVAALQRMDDQGHRLSSALIVAPTLKDPPLEIRLYAAAGAYHHAHGRLPKALNYLMRCLIMAEMAQRPDLALRPLNLLGQTFCAVGKLEASLPYLDRASAAADAAGEPALAARSLAYAAVAHWFRGEAQAADSARAAALERAAQASGADQSGVEAILGYGLTFAGQHETALPLLESSVGRALPRHDLPLQMLAHGALGNIGLARQDIDQASAHLNRALEIAAGNRTATVHLPVIHALRSLIALAGGNYPAAVRGVEEALDLAEATQQPLAQAICQQLLCRILLDAPNPDWTTGEYLLLESMAYYRQEHAAPLIAQTTADLGRVYLAQGHVALAETTLADALAQMESLAMAWDAAQVRLLLASIAANET